jgi:hypothetical protein
MINAEILELKEAYEVNQVSQWELFEVACDDAYKVRYCGTSVPTQCRIRAKHLAFPITAMTLDLIQIMKAIANEN